MGRAARCLGAGLACLMMCASAALGDGSPKIAGAPAITFGQAEFGNTLNGGRSLNGTYNSYWSLPVIAGDQITVEWQGQTNSPPDTPQLAIYPVGTTDADVVLTHPVVSKAPHGKGVAELQFTATKTGTMPTDLEVRGCALLVDKGCAGHAGPYALIAFVRHAARLGLPAMGSLPLSGTVAVSTRTPDGTAISDSGLYVFLQIKPGNQQWANVGMASPSAGVASVAYIIPASLVGQHVQVRAVTGGPNYLSEQSGAEQVLVVHPAPAHRKHKKHRKHRRHRRHGRRGKHHRRHRRHKHHDRRR